MNKRFVFRNYWWIALLLLGFALVIILSTAKNDQGTVIASIIGIVSLVLGFCYFVQQQKVNETSLFKELFTNFNSRYDRARESQGA